MYHLLDLLLVAACLLASPPAALDSPTDPVPPGPVTLTISPSQESFLIGQAITFDVVATNTCERAANLPVNLASYLHVTIHSDTGDLVACLPSNPRPVRTLRPHLRGSLQIAPAETLTQTVCLPAYVHFPRPGAYLVECTASIPAHLTADEAQAEYRFTIPSSSRFEIQVRQGDAEELESLLTATIRAGRPADAPPSWLAVDMVSRSDPQIAARVLGREMQRITPPPQFSTIEQRFEWLETVSNHPRFSSLAAEALLDIGTPEAAEILFEVARSDAADDFVRRIALLTLVQRRTPGILPLLDTLLTHPRPAIRLAVLDSCNSLRDSEAIRRAELLLGDHDPMVAASARTVHDGLLRHQKELDAFHKRKELRAEFVKKLQSAPRSARPLSPDEITQLWSDFLKEHNVAAPPAQ